MADFRPSSSMAHDPEDLSPLEREVLEEYARLVGNLDDVCSSHLLFSLFFGSRTQLANVLNDLAAKPSAEILDSLRGLERKTSTVFTLLKASVYSIVLQQEIADGDGVQ